MMCSTFYFDVLSWTFSRGKEEHTALYRLKKMAIMTYKSFYNLNPEYINDMYQMKNVHYTI